MPDLETPLGQDVGDAQATQRRINPWWILAIVLVVLGVLLGVRKARKKKAKDAIEEAGGRPEFREPDEPDSDTPFENTNSEWVHVHVTETEVYESPE
jgi:hypothetical protein